MLPAVADYIFHYNVEYKIKQNQTIAGTMSSEDEKRELENEVDDLFGEDEQVPEKENNELSQDEGGDDNLGLGDDDEDDEEEEHELKTVDISLPRHAIAEEPESDTYALKVPVFLNVESHPFDPNEFKEKVKQSEESKSGSEVQIHSQMVSEKLLNENTIRWRYTNVGEEIVKQSNAHFVQWDDGSLSLKIGLELFDFKAIPLVDSCLVKAHDSKEILQSDSIINKSVNLLPASTHTSTHKRLTAAVKSFQRKHKILNTLTKDDPLLKQRIADENEKKTLKARRQLDAKRRMQEERMERNTSPSLNEPAYQRFARTYGEEEYDEEDDFVAGDDEELVEDEDEDEEEEEEEFERGAQRLKQLKEEGAANYKQTSEEPEQRKRRRIIEDDEDEE